MIRACPRHPRSIATYFDASSHLLNPYTHVKTDLEQQTGLTQFKTRLLHVHVNQLTGLQLTRVFDVVGGGYRLPVVAFALACGHSGQRRTGGRLCQLARARRRRRATWIGRSKGEFGDLLLRQIQGYAGPQRAPVVGKELERFFKRFHQAVELKRPPDEPHRRRQKLVALFDRRDEVSDSLRQSPHVVYLLVAIGQLRRHVEPERQRQLRRPRADELPRRGSTLIACARRRLQLIGETDLERFRIELDFSVAFGIDLLLELFVELPQFRFFQFDRFRHWFNPSSASAIRKPVEALQWLWFRPWR